MAGAAPGAESGAGTARARLRGRCSWRTGYRRARTSGPPATERAGMSSGESGEVRRDGGCEGANLVGRRERGEEHLSLGRFTWVQEGVHELCDMLSDLGG